MNLQPVLHSPLIEIRPLRPEDYSDLFLAASDPLIWKQHPSPDRYLEEEFQKFFLDALKGKGAVAVIDLKTEKIIGSSRYYEANLESKEVVIGYTFLKRDYWGGVYNRELKRLMINHALKSFTSVLFHVDEVNFRSQRAMEKIGGEKISEFKKSKKDGSFRNVFVYRMTHLLP
jgi:N-acetyltransferase